jgi:hypothetical protein
MFTGEDIPENLEELDWDFLFNLCNERHPHAFDFLRRLIEIVPFQRLNLQ